MPDSSLYPMIFKRKSFHLFRGVGSETISDAELDAIANAFGGFESLYPEIRTRIRIVPASRINFKRDAEYCVLLYSEKKGNYLMNAGYLGEQLDLWLTERNIGALWYGIGRPDEAQYDGLDYVIMLAIRKVSDPAMFRKDMYKAKRKPLAEIWKGSCPDYADTVRFAPSACNSQPWSVSEENGKLTVFRYRKNSRIGILTPSAAAYFNRIDIGIFLTFLELCMAEQGLVFSRELFPDVGDDEYTRVAEYSIRD